MSKSRKKFLATTYKPLFRALYNVHGNLWSRPHLQYSLTLDRLMPINFLPDRPLVRRWPFDQNGPFPTLKWPSFSSPNIALYIDPPSLPPLQTNSISAWASSPPRRPRAIRSRTSAEAPRCRPGTAARGLRATDRGEMNPSNIICFRLCEFPAKFTQLGSWSVGVGSKLF